MSKSLLALLIGVVCLSPCRVIRADGPAEQSPKIQSPKILARDPAKHGLLCRWDGKTVLLTHGTPEEMGAAHGMLQKDQVLKLAKRTIYLIGSLDTLRGDGWFFDRMEEISRRTSPHIPARFLTEIDALSRTSGMSQRDGRFANLFPERFHCSGVAVRGTASPDGRVYHARVLDYMSDINLQSCATIQVFMPNNYNAWVSAGYAGFVGTVTAMNEKGLAIGEMGGRGEGDWDGTPMSLLLRDVMERAGTVDEGLEILRAAPRTCEYYYVLSDKSRAIVGVRATPKELTVLKPGEQHPRLPHVPQDTVMISGGDRATALSQRLQENHGKIDAQKMIELIKRPVAARANLHNVVFSPETLDLWIADAGKFTPACDERYAQCNLAALLRFYKAEIVAGDK